MRSAFQLFSSMMNHPGKGVLTVVELQVRCCPGLRASGHTAVQQHLQLQVSCSQACTQVTVVRLQARQRASLSTKVVGLQKRVYFAVLTSPTQSLTAHHRVDQVSGMLDDPSSAAGPAIGVAHGKEPYAACMSSHFSHCSHPLCMSEL